MPKTKAVDKHQVHFPLPESAVKALDERSKDDDRSRSEYLEIVLGEVVDAAKSGRDLSRVKILSTGEEVSVCTRINSTLWKGIGQAADKAKRTKVQFLKRAVTAVLSEGNSVNA